MVISLVKYWFRIFFFLAITVGITLFLSPHLISFFRANIPINSLILCVFGIGIFYNIWILFKLGQECQWINAFIQDEPLPTKKLHFLKPMQTVDLNKNHQKLAPQNTQFIIENVEARLEENKSISRYVISLLVFLGLLGTFWGLLVTTSSLANIFSDSFSGVSSENVISTLLNQLSKPLSGMRTAFASSLFGLSASLILGFIHLQINQAQNRFILAVEEAVSKQTEWDNKTMSAEQMQHLLSQSQEQIYALAQLTAGSVNISESINQAVNTIHEDMPALYKHVEYTSQMMEMQKSSFSQQHSELLSQMNLAIKEASQHQKYYSTVLHYIARQLEQTNQNLAPVNKEQKKDLQWIELNEIKILLEKLLHRIGSNKE